VTLVELRGASVAFGPERHVALPDLRIDAAERVAIVGANGSGKSTLLRVLAGLLRPEAELHVQLAREHIGYVAQRPFLFRTTVQENVALGRSARSTGPDRAGAIRSALAAQGIDALADRAARTLSEGQQMRVALARALLRAPRLLLLDESFAPLDPEGASRLGAALSALTDTAIVAAAPSLDALARLRPTRVVRIG
jgi:tungstate transport system ATP-binding protein